MDANDLRRAFTKFFVDRGHTPVPSSSLIPHHPAAPLLSNAGMNQFIPIFLGEEPAPWPRATSVQKCFRTGDIEIIGTTTRHVTFFEMLGNFSFGDYFKEAAVPYAWDLVTEVLGLDADRLWASVYVDDDEAVEIWRDVVGLPAERVQRMGEDNFWEMQKGAPGPCGPSSEIWYDKGPEWGAGGGPAEGGEERYVEIWNLVFMQSNRQADGSLVNLPRRNIDTGAGLERVLATVNATGSIFDTDELRAMVAAAESLTGRRYGDDAEVDVNLRILADHGRSLTFLISDGVFPSNEGRGYVLRRIIRRAVRRAFQLGVHDAAIARLVAAAVDVMGEPYPELGRNRDFITTVAAREEDNFRQTLRSGLTLLEGELEGGQGRIAGEVAFKLHDTYGFPIELTTEIAAERGVEVDEAGFRAAMDAQRRRAKEAAKKRGADAEASESYREILDQWGPTEFTGYREYGSTGRVLAVLPAAEGRLEVFLDRTPFYAEGGGQVGDTGTITSETGSMRVIDTTAAVPGLHRHLAVAEQGHVTPGQEVRAEVDAERRDAIRRNHTGTHLLQWALREALGPHVKQQGSLVAPDYLRFDFSHFGPMTPEEIEGVETLVNGRILADEHVRAFETSRSEAEKLGAIAMFGEKYGEVVRVVEAGSRSRELCGGTHVDALGMIGPLKITSEASIGSNTRRIVALTGTGTLERVREEERALARAAELLRAQPDQLVDAVERSLARQRELSEEVKTLRARSTAVEVDRLAASAADGLIVSRVDGVAQDQLRELAAGIRSRPGVRAVVLIGSPDGARVALVAATAKDSGLDAAGLIAEAARAVGGGGGKGAELAQAGGRDPSRIDEAVELARRRAQA